MIITAPARLLSIPQPPFSNSPAADYYWYKRLNARWRVDTATGKAHVVADGYGDRAGGPQTRYTFVGEDVSDEVTLSEADLSLVKVWKRAGIDAEIARLDGSLRELRAELEAL